MTRGGGAGRTASAVSAVVGEPQRLRRVDRRTVALVAFALAALSVLVLPGAIGRNVVGVAVAGPVPAGPQEGDCRAPLTSALQLDGLEDAVPVVACSRPHSGEIIHVGELDTDVRPGAPNADATLTAGLEKQCRDLVRRFVAGVRDTHPLGRIDPRTRARLTVPSEPQWAQGQRWVSCQVLPATDTMPLSWQGTARLAVLRTPPPQFATCADAVNGTPVDCAAPHRAEQLSWNDQPEKGIKGCTEVVAAIMNVEDPTVGGQLAVVGRRTSSWTSCWVASTGAPLTDTVIGIGDAPLPLG